MSEISQGSVTNNRYGRMQEANHALNTFREHAREVRGIAISEGEIHARLNEERDIANRLFEDYPELGTMALLACGVSMKQITMHQTTEEGLLTFEFDTRAPLQVVDAFGIDTKDAILYGCGVNASTYEDDALHIETMFFLKDPQTLTTTISAAGAQLAAISINRTIIFPAHSDDTLIIKELDLYHQRRELYKTITQYGEGATQYVNAIKDLERALASQNDFEFTSLRHIDFLHGVARHGSDLIKSGEINRDIVENLFSFVLGRGRRVTIQSPGTKIVTTQGEEVVDDIIQGEFVDVFSSDQNGLIGVFSVVGADLPAEAHINLAEVVHFRF